MARITVEDCMDHVDNLFQLVLMAAKRGRRLANGAEPTVDWENDKPTVVALREIAAGHITSDILDEPEHPVVDVMEGGPGPDHDLRPPMMPMEERR